MENAKIILQEAVGAVETHYNTVKAAFDAYDVCICALKKHNTTVLEIIFDKKELEYERIIWQIITDLRRARDIDLDCNEEAAGWDYYYLSMISNIVEKHDKGIELIETTALNQKEYEAVCSRKNLVF